jgi:hypothetical protein
MSAGAPHPQFLRLVGSQLDFGDPPDDDAAPSPTWHERQRLRLEVVKENRLAAQGGASVMDPNDPRWVLAAQTQQRLQGATLAPEDRDQLLARGKRLGLRAFEANLIIAIVQDQARHTRPGLTASRAGSSPAMPTQRNATARLQPTETADDQPRTSPAEGGWSPTLRQAIRWFNVIGTALLLAALWMRWLSRH